MRVSVPSFKGSSSRLSHLGKSLSLGLGPWQLPPSAPLPPAEIALIVSGRMVERGGHQGADLVLFIEDSINTLYLNKFYLSLVCSILS